MDAVPPASYPLIPVLSREAEANWPGLRPRSALAAQVDKETCITRTHRFCWNPRAELKTSREYGFGLGQFTIAYTQSRQERFNVWRDLRSKHPDKLFDWTWERRFEPELQMRAMVLYGHSLWKSCNLLMDEALACTFASYNGGLGGLMSDRRLCQATEGCNPRLWFGHVEKYSLKQKTTSKGYGDSFFDINRRYVREVLQDRRWKYAPLIDQE